jgi:ferric-dicitrate binding protein FerR (iron transport regulator)
MKRTVWALLLCLLSGPALAGDVAGWVSRTQGEARQEGGPILVPGVVLPVGAVLATGRASRLEIKLIDGTELTLGENSSLALDAVFFDLAAQKGNVLVRVVDGAFRAVTGRVGDLPGKPFVLKTRLATIGIRGTTFWGGPIDGAFGVALLDGKGIYVETREGRVELTAIGQGTTLIAGQPPETPVAWMPDKVGRALDTITFRPGE